MRLLCVMLLFVVASGVGCRPAPEAPGELTLATTTSTYDSGLLDELLPEFEKQEGIRVKVIAVGTGRAIDMGRRGDADVLLTHAPALETDFMKKGWGMRRESIMSNDFVLVGPADDPAQIQKADSVVNAFQKLDASGAFFVSRGDRSGTHIKELEIREKARPAQSQDRILDSGSGMGATLRMAHEKQAYTITDRGTYLSLQDTLDLEILFQGDELLQNPYAAMVTNPDRHPHVHHQAANKLIDYLLLPTTQRRISQFGRDRYGQPLFFPSTEVESR